jgi:protein TonB
MLRSSLVLLLLAIGLCAQETPERVLVGSGIMRGLLVKQVVPVYPAEVKKQRIQGKVMLDVTIGKDGRVIDVKNPSGPEELWQVAIDAVRQWQYKPYLLNREPVEVATHVEINFRLN